MAAQLARLVVSPVAQAGEGIVGEWVWVVGWHVGHSILIAVDWTGTYHGSKKHLQMETRQDKLRIVAGLHIVF